MDENEKVYPKGVVPRGKEFQDKLALKGSIYLFLREELEKLSERAFEKAGYSRSENPRGQYADGRVYGMGVDNDKYNVKIGGKTQTSLDKQMSLGGKRLVVDIGLSVNAEQKVAKIHYKTTEQAAFKSVDGKPLMINDSLVMRVDDVEKFKKELSKKLSVYADKEVSYLANVKLGVDDTVEKVTEFIKESTYSIGDIFMSKNLLENKYNIDDVTSGGKFLSDLEDDERPLSDEEIASAYDGVKVLELKVRFMEGSAGGFFSGDIVVQYPDKSGDEESDGTIEKWDTWIQYSENEPNRIAFNNWYPEETNKKLISIIVNEINEHGDFIKSEKSEFTTIKDGHKVIPGTIDEITSASSGSAGGFAYDAPIGKIQKRKMAKRFEETEYGKKLSLKEGKGYWRPMIVENENGGWTVVTQDELDGYKKDHIMGAPGAEGIEINSKAEEEYNSGGINKFPGGKSFKKKAKNESFMLNETGEWEDDEEGIAWKQHLKNTMQKAIDMSGVKGIEIEFVKGFDKYQGPYGMLKMPNGKRYKFWQSDYPGLEDGIWIENFPINNSSEEGMLPGFMGDVYSVSEALENCCAKDVKEAINDFVTEEDSLSISESIRKRWIPEKKVTIEEKFDRWSKLASFEKGSTIRMAESVTPDKKVVSESYDIRNSEDNTIDTKPLQKVSDIQDGDIFEGHKVVKITRKKGFFDVDHFVYEKDYLNESKAYIWDFSSGILINNPNYKNLV